MSKEKLTKKPPFWKKKKKKKKKHWKWFIDINSFRLCRSLQFFVPAIYAVKCSYGVMGNDCSNEIAWMPVNEPFRSCFAKYKYHSRSWRQQTADREHISTTFRFVLTPRLIRGFIALSTKFLIISFFISNVKIAKSPKKS